MVLDIRKDLLQRKQKSQPQSSATGNPREAPRVQDPEAAETLEGPFSPPCSYDPLVFNLHNSLSREAQPRPLRVPCSACTFVPHQKQSLAQSRNGLHRKSHPFRHKQLPVAAASHGECCVIDGEEPCAEDIAGDHQSFTVECIASIQPIKVSCSACTSSLRAPVLYGHTAVVPKVKPKKCGKHPKASSTEAIPTASTDCPVQDLHNDRDRDVQDCGWFVRPDKGPCTSLSGGSAMVPRSSQSAALEKKRSLNAVPVEVDAIHNVEIVERHSPHESIAVTCQATLSCENISDIAHENTELAAGEMQPHRCSVKHVAKQKGLRTVPVEVETVQSVEVVGGGTPPESIAYQTTRSCEDISDIVPEVTEVSAGKKKPYLHDCFVKRVERACAKMTGSKGAATDRMVQSRPRPSSAMWTRERRNSSANKRSSRHQHHPQQQQAASLAGNNDQYIADQADEQGMALYEQESDARDKDRYNAVNEGIEAVPDFGSFSMQEKSIENKRVSRQSRQEHLPTDPRKSKSASQDDTCAMLQPRISMVAAPSTKDDEQVNLYEAEASTSAKKRSSSRIFVTKEHAVALQTPNLDSHSQTAEKSSEHEEGTKEPLCMQAKTSSADEEGAKKEQPLRLSVEVFPSPSAPKGFGLKIVQHFPKMVDVEYVNGLGLSPRSFQTVPCQQCSSAGPPLKL